MRKLAYFQNKGSSLCNFARTLLQNFASASDRAANKTPAVELVNYTLITVAETVDTMHSFHAHIATRALTLTRNIAQSSVRNRCVPVVTIIYSCRQPNKTWLLEKVARDMFSLATYFAGNL